MPRRYGTDCVARNIWFTLLRDFRTSEGSDFCRKAEDAFVSGLASFREFTPPELGYVPVGRFKRHQQMQSLLKKYRFAEDAYTDEELQDKTLRKYFTEQERLAVHTPMGPLALKVVQRARKIARSILGSYDPESVIVNSEFGKKSSIGCSLSLAYIDEKLSTVKAFTGSSQCTRWFFNDVLPDDPLLSRMVAELGVSPDDERLQHESLTLINVPKSWKTYRTITPLTLLSLFYSNGVVKLVTARLREAGLDIRRLQSRHRYLVKGFSMSRTHATADLSAASDSLTSELLNRILPRKWYCAVKKTFTHQVEYQQDGIARTCYTESVLPMGNGLTFPVETLIFYSIIRALGELTDVRGVFSVYGDDLIYPSKLHRYVARVFPKLKLVLNVDKTYVSYPFRESCGSDFYRGCDVRPFFLQGEHRRLTPTQYLGFLYKTYNGLTRRWDPMEIRSTLVYLLTEMTRVADEIHRVPPGFPDTAGIKVSDVWSTPLGAELYPWSPICVRLYGGGNAEYKFKFLMSTSNTRFIKSIHPYYWLALQGKDDVTSDATWSGAKRWSYYTVVPRQPIRWLKQVRTRYYNSRGKRLKKKLLSYVPITASRTGEQQTIKGGSTAEWI